MMLDDVYGNDLDDAATEQEALWRERMPPELEWDENEESLVVADLVGGFRMSNHG